MATPANTSSISGQILARLTAVEIDVAVIKSNHATREDIAKTHIMIAETHALIAQVEAGQVCPLSKFRLPRIARRCGNTV